MESKNVSRYCFDRRGERAWAVINKYTLKSNFHRVPTCISWIINHSLDAYRFFSNDADKGNESIVRGITFFRSDGSINQTYDACLNQTESLSSSCWGDVILSVGALGSPQILLLSGIGPKKYLKNLSIPIELDLKGVGQEMKDK